MHIIYAFVSTNLQFLKSYLLYKYTIDKDKVLTEKNKNTIANANANANKIFTFCKHIYNNRYVYLKIKL